jgi:hypothetical protein
MNSLNNEIFRDIDRLKTKLTNLSSWRKPASLRAYKELAPSVSYINNQIINLIRYIIFVDHVVKKRWK